MEHERIIITRFRAGTHNLRIETGRYENVPRELRTCVCGTALQTIKHFLIECPLLVHLRHQNHTSVSECLRSENIMFYIMQGAKILGIEL